MEWNAIQCVSFPIGKRLLAKNRFHMVFAMHIAHVFGKGRIFCRVAHLFGKKTFEMEISLIFQRIQIRIRFKQLLVRWTFFADFGWFWSILCVRKRFLVNFRMYMMIWSRTRRADKKVETQKKQKSSLELNQWNFIISTELISYRRKQKQAKAIK